MELFEHQINALERTKDLNHVAYYHDMGLGKTYTGAEKMIRLGAKVNLVVCQKSKVDDWVDHFNKNYPEVLVYDLTTWKKENWFVINSWCNYPTSRVRILIINYDLVWRRSELKQLKDFTLMLDESSLIQIDAAKRTEFIMNLQSKNVILLSGTPSGGKYENLMTQIHLLGWNINKDTFWNQYIDWEWNETDDGYWQKKILGYKNVDRLKRKLRQHGCDFLKTEEVLDLPKQIDQWIKIDSTEDYKKFRKDAYIYIDNKELIGDNILIKMLRERQLCGMYNQYKISAFIDLLESTNDRLIVFYNFDDELETLKHISDSLGRALSIVNGKIKDLYAYYNRNDSVTFIQYQSGAKGLNLQDANKVIYFTPPLSSEDFEQSKKRIHRIGQEKTCFYYYLICKNSIEEKIYNTLAMRHDYTEDLFKEEENANR